MMMVTKTSKGKKKETPIHLQCDWQRLAGPDIIRTPSHSHRHSFQSVPTPRAAAYWVLTLRLTAPSAPGRRRL